MLTPLKKARYRLHAVFPLVAAILLLPHGAGADTRLQPRPGPEITQGVLDVQSNDQGVCLLQESGSLFCWDTHIPYSTGVTPEFTVDYESLNEALDNDITQFALDNFYACALSRSGNIACTDSLLGTDASFGLEDIPESETPFVSISDFHSGSSICARQADSRVVCWGGADSINNVKPLAQYLKQVSVGRDFACGVDLNDDLACWGNTGIDAGIGSYFANETIAAFGKIKQVEVGPYGTCVVRIDNAIKCSGGMSHLSDTLEGQSFKSINLYDSGGASLCSTDLENTLDCIAITYVPEIEDYAARSILPEGTRAKHIWAKRRIIQLNEGGSLLSYFQWEDAQSVFPTAPENLRRDIYSANAVELFWNRSSTTPTTNDYAQGYEIYRNDELIDVTGHLDSYYSRGIASAGTHRYTVKPFRGAVAGHASMLDAFYPAIDDVTEPSESDSSTPSPTGLSSAVYSAHGLEIFWDRSDNAQTTYDVYRNGRRIREGQYGISHWEPHLTQHSRYHFTVIATLNGVPSNPAYIIVETNPLSEETRRVVAPPTGLRIERYSSNDVELFWDRAPEENGTTRYEIFRNDVSYRTQYGISYFDTTASSDTKWVYKIEAINEQGRHSVQAFIVAPR